MPEPPPLSEVATGGQTRQQRQDARIAAWPRAATEPGRVADAKARVKRWMFIFWDGIADLPVEEQNAAIVNMKDGVFALVTGPVLGFTQQQARDWLRDTWDEMVLENPDPNPTTDWGGTPEEKVIVFTAAAAPNLPELFAIPEISGTWGNRPIFVGTPLTEDPADRIALAHPVTEAQQDWLKAQAGNQVDILDELPANWNFPSE